MREHDLSSAHWRKNSYSDGNGNGGNCVEVADGFPGTVPVRDGKATGGPVIAVGPAARTEFISAVGTTRFPASGPTSSE